MEMAETTAPEREPGTAIPGANPEGNPGEAWAAPSAERRAPRPPVDLNLIRADSTILAMLGVITLLYFAASVFITLFSALLLAFALEPLVHVLCVRTRMRRQHASGIVVFLFVACLYGLAWLAYEMLGDFLANLPVLTGKVRSTPFVAKILSKVQSAAQLFEETGHDFLAAPGKDGRTLPQVVVRDAETAVGAFFRRLGSLTGVFFAMSFVPFIVYFMLADREPLTRRTRELFPEGYHQTAGVILMDVERVMRKFLLGNAVIVGTLSAATILLFWAVGLPNPAVLGGISGTLSIVPYLGLPLALLPGVVVGLATFTSGGPFLLVVLGVTVLHLVSANYLTPKFVGGEVHLNATAATSALLFFGWLWGAMGLLLGIPILAVLKCILDNIPSTQRLGMWLGD